VLEIIRPVGLAPKKSQFLVGLAQKLVTHFDAKIPHSLEELESLPGVGRKTASVVMSVLFGVPSFAVDTHVHRLALRWVCVCVCVYVYVYMFIFLCLYVYVYILYVYMLICLYVYMHSYYRGV
jgi:hypothetical protein